MRSIDYLVELAISLQFTGGAAKNIWGEPESPKTMNTMLSWLCFQQKQTTHMKNKKGQLAKADY